MNYSEMSDFEINKAVAKHFTSFVFFNNSNEPVRLVADPAATYTGRDFDEEPFDPCNSWADAGPIIGGARIAIMPSEMKSEIQWISTSGRGQYQYHANPLRAAMIVFLMMQEEK